MPAVRVGTALRVFWRVHRMFMRLTGGRFGRTGTLPALDPAWWRNLEANPEGQVLVGGKRLRVPAREAEGAERERLWASFTRADPSYREYQQRTKRQLPVVLLVPL